MSLRLAPLSAALLLLAACASAPEREPDEQAEVDPLLSEAGVAHAVVEEAFVSVETPRSFT